MGFITALIDFILHIDDHMAQLTADYGVWVYAILFLILFCETGLVVTPFLPGDSLLFAVGALAANDALNLPIVLVLMSVAAIIGDTVNYWIGHVVGPKVFERDSRFIKRKHLERTQEFYDKYGGKTIILARFVPIVRTFAPFVAGVGKMNYSRFILFNVAGGLLWIFSMTLAGYFFGNITFVKENFSLVVLGIIFVSILPMVFEFVRARRNRNSEGQPTLSR